MIKKYNQFLNEGILDKLKGPTLDELIENIGIENVIQKAHNNADLLFKLYTKFKDNPEYFKLIENEILHSGNKLLIRLYELGIEITPKDLNERIVDLSLYSAILRKRLIDLFYNEIHLDKNNILLLKELLEYSVLNTEEDNVEKIFEITNFEGIDLVDIFIRAVGRPNEKIVKFLLDKGIDFKDKDYDIYSNAINEHNYKIIELLVDYGCKVDNHVVKEAAFHFREEPKDDYKILDLLIKNNSVEKEDYLLREVLGRNDCASILVKNGYDVHVSNDYPIFYSVVHCDYELSKLLLEHGANILNTHQDNMIVEPIRENDIELVKLLMKYNIKIEHPYPMILNCVSEEMKKLIIDYTDFYNSDYAKQYITNDKEI